MKKRLNMGLAFLPARYFSGIGNLPRIKQIL